MTAYRYIGKNVTVFPRAQCIFPENISIGDESLIDDGCFLYAAGRGIEIGRFCHVTAGSHLQSGGLLKMEDFSAVSPHCIVLAASDDYQGEGFIGLKVFGDKYRKMHMDDVILERHAHVGAGSIILPGVTIGEGCSIGAGSVVTKSMPPWTICYGNPCRPRKEKPKDKQLSMEAEFLAEYAKREAEAVIVSICCLTYNHERFIRQALDGFLMQETSFPFEIIVHDDASTDKTAEIIREYAGRFPGIIRPIFQTENQFGKTGIYPIVNCYAAARGRYIAECDGDDYWTDPLKLQRQVDFMEHNQDAVMCHHAYLCVRDGQIIVPSTEAPRDYSAEELVAFPVTSYGIATSTKLFRNLYTEDKRAEWEAFAGDYPLNVLLGMLDIGGARFVDGIKPSVYRKHGGNSWSELPTSEIIARTRDMHKRLYDLISAKGNARHVELRRAFIRG